MNIKVKTSTLMSSSSTARRLSDQLNEQVMQLRSIRYSLDYKVRGRYGIDYSINSIETRIEKLHEKMYNISRFLSDTAVRYDSTEAAIISRASGITAADSKAAENIYNRTMMAGVAPVFGTPIAAFQYDPNTGAVTGKGEGKKWYQSNIFKIGMEIVLGAGATGIVGSRLASTGAIGMASASCAGKIFDKVRNSDFVQGLSVSVDNNFTLGAMQQYYGYTPPDSFAFKAGKVTGDVLSFLVGGGIASGGAVGEIFGVAMDGTLVLAPAGVAVCVASATAIVTGSAVMAVSGNNLYNDAQDLMKNVQGKGQTSKSDVNKGGSKAKYRPGFNKDGEMLGKNGTRVDSDTKWQNGKTERVDVENQKPGKRPGDVHYHDPNNVKYRFDPVTGKLYDELGNLAPNKIQKVLQNKDVQKALNKGIEVLGEEKYFK